MKICYLGQGVHPCIGSSGADQADLLTCHLLQGGFDDSLNAYLTDLPLPAVISCSVVLDGELYVSQWKTGSA